MSKKRGTAFPTFQLKVFCEGYFAKYLYLQAMDLAMVWRELVMSVHPDLQNSRVRDDG